MAFKQPKKVCERTGKLCWAKNGASKMVGILARKRGMEGRYYRCNFCNKYHMTRSPLVKMVEDDGIENLGSVTEEDAEEILKL